MFMDLNVDEGKVIHAFTTDATGKENFASQSGIQAFWTVDTIFFYNFLTNMNLHASKFHENAVFPYLYLKKNVNRN